VTARGSGDDYQKVVRVEADAHAVFDALTTATGLTAWWASATGDGGQRGELRLTMNAPEPLVLRVDEAVRPRRVAWSVVDCALLPEWAYAETGRGSPVGSPGDLARRQAAAREDRS
jgi:uncharacterized protein YndB with AHSA1/START domain